MDLLEPSYNNVKNSGAFLTQSETDANFLKMRERKPPDILILPGTETFLPFIRSASIKEFSPWLFLDWPETHRQTEIMCHSSV